MKKYASNLVSYGIRKILFLLLMLKVVSVSSFAAQFDAPFVAQQEKFANEWASEDSASIRNWQILKRNLARSRTSFIS